MTFRSLKTFPVKEIQNVLYMTVDDINQKMITFLSSRFQYIYSLQGHFIQTLPIQNPNISPLVTVSGKENMYLLEYHTKNHIQLREPNASKPTHSTRYDGELLHCNQLYIPQEVICLLVKHNNNRVAAHLYNMLLGHYKNIPAPFCPLKSVYDVFVGQGLMYICGEDDQKQDYIHVLDMHNRNHDAYFNLVLPPSHRAAGLVYPYLVTQEQVDQDLYLHIYNVSELYIPQETIFLSPQQETQTPIHIPTTYCIVHVMQNIPAIYVYNADKQTMTIYAMQGIYDVLFDEITV